MVISAINNMTDVNTDIFNKLLHSSPVSFAFIAAMILILLFNLVKKALVHYEQRRGKVDEKCIYLKSDKKSLYCSLPCRSEWFLKNHRGCAGCRKKTTAISNTEAEMRAKNSAWWKSLIISTANGGKSILPYLSFAYTLTLAIMGIPQK